MRAARGGPLLLLALALLWCVPLRAATYYVSTAGSDANDGASVDSPFRTIQHAVDGAVAGDTILVRGGTYREDVEMNTGGTATQPIVLSAYPGEVPVIKGSDVVGGWVRYDSAIWEKQGWPFDSQQVFVDFDASPGPPLQQIGMPSRYYTSWEYPNPAGSGLASMTEGSFYYDPSASTLYVWLPGGADPNKHVIEASVRRRLLFLHQPNVVVKGLAFRHSNASAFAQQGAAVELSTNSAIEGCDIQYADFAGLQMGYRQKNTRASNCVVSNNGDSGVNAAGTTGFRVANVTMNRNNRRGFNPLWHAGGFKASSGAYGTVEDSEVGYNNGSGIWFDYAGSGAPIVIRNNYVHDNGPVDSAIFFEVSDNGLIYNNVLVDNGRRGIYLAASNDTGVYNNTVVGTSNRAGIELGGMPRSGATLSRNAVYNNIVAGGSSQYDLYVAPDDGSSITGNRSDYNDFYRSSGAISLWSGSAYHDLASWSAATGFGAHSIDAAPGFAGPGPAAGYALAGASPAIDDGIDLGGVVPYDYLKVARPSGAGFDIGAFEYVAADGSASGASGGGATADTTRPLVKIDAITRAGVRGPVTLSASATDDVGVTGMTLSLDGRRVASSSGAKVSYKWRHPADGSHRLEATATDAAGNVGSASATVTVR